MKKVKYLLIIALAFLLNANSLAQEKKNLTLEDLYERPTFQTKGVRGMNPMRDGETYGTIERGEFNIYNYKTGKKVNTLFNFMELVPKGDSLPIRAYNYILSDDETKALFLTNVNYIYRHSFTADYYVYDIASKKLVPLSTNGGQRLATFSPDGTKVAFMRDNNLFIKDLDKNKETQFTFDGLYNNIINGAPDWV